MSNIQPIAHNAQVQRITTALKNICRDYPAGGTVLRELLQNADDAGATEARFIIDDRTHPTDNLIHPLLAQYQGPALLAYNNAEFTQKDFDSLSRLGDSLKMNDASTTGKFGRGFNSVYNWTDSPSILSRERLLILDPHHEWSDGGPVYDFVANSGALTMQNHMAAYKSIMQHTDRPLAGTVIRIPLRNPEQALKSEISGRVATALEVAEVLKSFSSEFGDSGLLFMRNLEKLELGDTSSIAICIEVGGESLQSHKSKINSAVRSALTDPQYSFDHSFEAAMHYRTEDAIKNTAFIIHHSIQCGSMNKDMRAWTRAQNLIPWIAVAAQLPKEPAEPINGSLFTVLPLPIATNQPIHIHGLFSLSPDRARLHQFNERSTQDQEPAVWNDWLLQGPIPIAWTKLLGYLACLHPNQSFFHTWPQSTDDTRDPFSNALENVIEVIEKECLPLWLSEAGYVTSQDGFLYTGYHDAALRDALREAGVPVVYVPRGLQHRARELFQDRILRPEHLCRFLRSGRRNRQIPTWTESTKHKILEYLLSEPGFTDYAGLELFPFMDGFHRSIGDVAVFVHRDEFENRIFNHDNSRNLDLGKLSANAQLALRQFCESGSPHEHIRYRSVSCFRDYCMRNIFTDVPEDQDMVDLDDESAAFVCEIWTWVLMRGVDLLDKDICCLWLLRLSNGKHRKVRPKTSISQIYFAPASDLGDLMRKYDARSARKLLPLLDTRDLAFHSISYLVENPNAPSDLLIEDGSKIVSFIIWLHRTIPMLDHVSEKDRLLIAELISSKLTQPLPLMDRDVVVGALRDLKIFQKLTWSVTRRSMLKSVLTWTNLSSCDKSIGLLDGIQPVPEIEGLQFLLADHSSSSDQLLKTLELVDCLNSVEIIQKYIIPAWQSGRAENWTSSSKEHMAESILGQFSCLTLPFQTRLQTLPMVPVSQLNGKETSSFAIAPDLIDSSALQLRELCFDDEKVLPRQRFFDKFKVALKGCGLKAGLDKDFVEQRVRCYASNKYSLLEVQTRALKLLKSAFHWTFPQDKQQLEMLGLRRLKWLPATDFKGALVLKASDECRDENDQLLVNSQLPVVNTVVTPEWRIRLGWDNTLSSRLLLSQLERGIAIGEAHGRKIVDAVLQYIWQKKLVEELADDLTSLPCVLASGGNFVVSSVAFRPQKGSTSNYTRLHPYIANVDRKFWQEHQDLLIKINVRDNVQPDDLLKVQMILETKPQLEDPDIGVAIEILNFASRFPRESLGRIKVIDETRVFREVHDIAYNDLGLLKSKTKVNIAHPDIPIKTLKALGIDSSRDRLIKGMLEIEDVDDEDEFEQRESVTTRITDTLDRYPIETTFNEYLANADDANGTSKISWLLDKRNHPSNRLLTPELKQFQGASLLVHNDGVFSGEDLEGFKNVGEGSKARNPEAIGQFGRGSQTMYHWTDVPMILSGKYLLILDPQQRVLPKNQIKGKRKPGVRLELSKLRDACSDQLTPFEKLWGYEMSLDNYPATIFRFPLRTAETKSLLRTGKTNLKHETAQVCQLMKSYFNEARISLLFLKRIQSIDFSINGCSEPGWSIVRRPPTERGSGLTSELVVCSFDKTMESTTHISGTDSWCIAIVDPQTRNQIRESSRRVAKHAECGLAALLSSKSDAASVEIPEVIQSRIFNTLPLGISSDLPVHVHATFSLSGDRKSISIDGDENQFEGSERNRALLQDALPKLYLDFLEDLGKQAIQDAFKFWPQQEPPKRSCAELLCKSFWEQLPTSSKRVFTKSQLTNKAPKRLVPPLIDFNQAVFDFLPNNSSEKLTRLLLSLGVDLVLHVPIEVAKLLKALPGVQSVTGQLLRQLLKSDSSSRHLLEEMAHDPLTWEVLCKNLVPADSELEELDGCYVLPLADGSLAPLRLQKSQDTQPQSYYVVSEIELNVFNFAAGLLVSPGTGERLKEILESGKFNITKLRLCHVEKLLKMRPVEATTSPEGDQWLTEFWKFWNASHDPSPDIAGLQIYIFRATVNGVEVYATPADFSRLPSVVEPSDSEHEKLCNKIPGLYRFDKKFMPESFTSSERSFESQVSFRRLVKAMQLLAKSKNKGIESFVRIHLDDPHVKILRTLIISHNRVRQWNYAQTIRDFVKDLKQFPIWPSFQESTTVELIPADGALMSVDQRLLVPWMKHRDRFISSSFATVIDNQNCLLNLGAKSLDTQETLLNYVLPLPSILNDTYWGYFSPLISAISGIYADGIVPQNLKESKIAADGNRILRTPNELYDHDDKLFTSAFRHESGAKFLHTDLRDHKVFWKKVGLRHRVDRSIIAGDYILCLRAMTNRLNTENKSSDQTLEPDLQEVLSPMTSPGVATRSFTAGDWSTIAQERVFRSSTGFDGEPEYRRSAMTAMAGRQRLMSLSDIISQGHIAVCWSQTSFAVHQPTQDVLNAISGKGRPKTSMVWRHLLHMKQISQQLKRHQLQDFLADLHKIYDYLQGKLDKSISSFDLQNCAVWLNLTSSDHSIVLMDDVRSSWHGIQDLVLSSSCDAGPIKAVRPSLMPYEKLLRALGCKSINYPTVTRPDIPQSRSLKAHLQAMWKEERQVDITFSTEGKLIKAHQVILGAVSDKFAAQFSGRWTVENNIRYDKDEDPENFLTYHTLMTMLQHAYEEPIAWDAMQVGDSDDADAKTAKLNLLLDILKGADMWQLDEMKSQIEDKILVAGRAFINLENVKEVRKRADLANGKAVAQMCALFIQQNQDAVDKAYSGRSD